MKLNKRKGIFKADWRPVKDYEKYYEISNLGQVRSLDRYIKEKSGKVRFTKGILLKATRKENKYLVVNLNKNGKAKMFKVHRLVALNFIQNPNNKPHVDHIDTNILNNRVFNLRWVTQSENNNNPLTKKHNSEGKKGEKSAWYGRHHTEESKKKISESKKGEKHHFYGKHHTEEHKKYISEIMKGRKSPMKNKHRTEESKKKMSENNKNKKKVLCIETNIIYNSILECSKAMNISTSNISTVCNGRRETTKGYHFKFID